MDNPYNLDAILDQQENRAAQLMGRSGRPQGSASAELPPVEAPAEGVSDGVDVDAAAAAAAAADVGEADWSDAAIPEAEAAVAESAAPVSVPPVPSEGGEKVIAPPAEEVEQVRRVLQWNLRRAGGGVIQPSQIRISIGQVWQRLEEIRGDADIFQALSNEPAPAWFLKAARRALADLPRAPQMQPRQRVMLEKASGGQLLRTLVDVEGARAVDRLEHAARAEGTRVALQDPTGIRLGAQLMQAMEKGETLLQWTRARGINDLEADHAVISALGSFPPTRDWTAALDDEMAAVAAEYSRDSRRSLKNTKQQNAVALMLASERPEVFRAIPDALDHAQSRFRGEAGKLIDLHFPSKVLFALRTNWTGRTTDPRVDFAPYVQATPTNGIPQTPESRNASRQFYRNYAFLALGGIGKEYQQQRGGHLFQDLIARDLVPCDVQGNPVLGEGMRQQVDKLLSTVRVALQSRPAALEAQYKFLVEAKNPDIQLRMIGTYLATLPYRQHLLGSGPLSLWKSGVLSPRFARLLTVAYAEAPPVKVEPVAAFSASDRKQVREVAGLRMLLDDERMSDMGPLILWLRDHGKALESYRSHCSNRDKKEGLKPGTTAEQDRALMAELAGLPREARPMSVASCVLGLVRPNGANQKIASGEYGTPPDAAALMLSVATNVAVTAERSAYIADPAVVDALDRVTTSLTELGSAWRGTPADWRSLGNLLEEPPFSVALSPADFARFKGRMVEALASPEVQDIPQITYSAQARQALENVLALPAAPALLYARVEAEPAKVLLAAAVLQAEPNLAHPAVSFWSPLVDDMREQVKMLRAIDVVPAPEREPDGTYRRPLRGAHISAEEFEQDLSGAAARVNGIGAGEPLVLPEPPVAAPNWDSPESWVRASKAIDRNTRLISSLFGEHVRPADLPRILQNGATMAAEHAILLQHAADIAAHLFTAEPTQNGRLPELLDKTKALLAEMSVAQPGVSTSPRKASQEPARLVASQPRTIGGPTETLPAPSDAPAPLIDR